MPNMHFTHIPLHGGWWPRDVESLLNTTRMHRVDVVDPDGHPHAFISGLVSKRTEGHCVRALSAATLPARTKEYFTIAGTDPAKCRRASLFPGLCPAELFKPPEALFKARNIQYRRQTSCHHRSLLDIRIPCPG